MITLAIVLGIGIDWLSIEPRKALFWSAVINGMVAVPIMAAMMVVVSRHRTIGRFAASPTLLVLGWGATAVMTLAAAAMQFVK